jgi:hypothetical protein
MQTLYYRRWAPRKSPVRIEFPPDLLLEIRSQTMQDHDRGYLFGARRGNDVRILAARRAPQMEDPGLTDLEPVGIYVSRVRGEVFLTDSDMEQIDRLDAKVALVLAGCRAGFFVREQDGSMQTVRSYEEFWVPEASPRPQPLKRAPAPPPAGRHPWLPPVRHGRRFAAAAVFVGAPVLAFGYLQPLLPRPRLEVRLRETEGQLVVEWSRSAALAGGHLEIADRSGRTVLLVPPGSTSTTYAHHNADVEVLLSTNEGTGRALWKAPHIYGRPFDQRARR